MAKKLPKKLSKEPLIDALFEVRFVSRTPASVVLPGFLFEKLPGTKDIQSLPASQIPKPMRDTDSNLRFAPLSRINWENFLINIGDNVISIGCKMPYPGWPLFKPAILKVIGAINNNEIVKSIERYSMKYVDLIPSSNLQEQISMINGEVAIAGHRLEKENFQLRLEIPKDEFINIIQIISSAKVPSPNGETKEGIIVDIDTILSLDSISIPALLEDFSTKLETIHQVNKMTFFDCIKESTIMSLEPVYE